MGLSGGAGGEDKRAELGVAMIFKKRKSEEKSRFWVVIVVVFSAFILAFFAYKSGMNKAELTFAKSKPQISATSLKEALNEISELATIEYNYTSMGQFENSNDFYGVKMPFSTKKFVVSFDGVIKAGVDLDRTYVEMREKEIIVTMPKAEILSHEIYENSLQVYDEKNGLFNSLTITDFNEFYIEQKSAMEKRAIEKGMLEKAHERAEDSIKNIFGYLSEDGYTLRIRQR